MAPISTQDPESALRLPKHWLQREACSLQILFYCSYGRLHFPKITISMSSIPCSIFLKIGCYSFSWIRGPMSSLLESDGTWSLPLTQCEGSHGVWHTFPPCYVRTYVLGFQVLDRFLFRNVQPLHHSIIWKGQDSVPALSIGLKSPCRVLLALLYLCHCHMGNMTWLPQGGWEIYGAEPKELSLDQKTSSWTTDL